MEDRTETAERIIPADAQTLFEIVADPRMHPVIDGSGTVMGTMGQIPERLSLGAKFGMSMKIGLPYPIRNTVIAFEEGRHIGWRHMFHHEWHYEFEPVDGGTRVTETYDWGAGWMPPAYYRSLGFIKAARRSMPATLERLEEVALQQ